MPYTKVLIHFIWATKNREHLISKELKPLLIQHIKDNSIKKDIFIDTINCVCDHIHLLISHMTLKIFWLKPIPEFNIVHDLKVVAIHRITK